MVHVKEQPRELHLPPDQQQTATEEVKAQQACCPVGNKQTQILRAHGGIARRNKRCRLLTRRRRCVVAAGAAAAAAVAASPIEQLQIRVCRLANHSA